MSLFGLTETMGSSSIERRRDLTVSKKETFLGFGDLVKDFVRVCWSGKNSRKMLIFLTINLIFMFVELGYGIYSNSLGLISDSFHMLTDCFSLFVALAAAYISVNKADNVYTFGFERV